MFRQLNFRSFFNFLGRNKLYAAINIFGLSVSLMFVILIADYTLRQLTCDDYHAKADRIYVIGNEECITSGYYLQKYLRDRYPEIESTCAVAVSGQSTDATQPVEVGLQKYSATILFADTTFFRIFDYQLLDGDREQVLASRDNVVLSESFARKVFGTFNPMGQVIRFPDEEKSYVVSGVVRDIDRSVIPNMDIIMRAERLCDINSANDEHMSNSGAVTTFILARPGADLTAKIPDMLDYFKEIYWIYKGNVYQHVTLTPLRDVYFLSQNNDGGVQLRQLALRDDPFRCGRRHPALRRDELYQPDGCPDRVSRQGDGRPPAAGRLARRNHPQTDPRIDIPVCCGVRHRAFPGSRGGARRFAAAGVENRRLAGYDACRRGLLCRVYRGAGRRCGLYPGDGWCRATNPWTSSGDRSATAPRCFTARCLSRSRTSLPLS